MSQTLSQNYLQQQNVVNKQPPPALEGISKVIQSEEKPLSSKNKRKLKHGPIKRQTQQYSIQQRKELPGSRQSAGHQKRTSSYIGCYKSSENVLGPQPVAGNSSLGLNTRDAQAKNKLTNEPDKLNTFTADELAHFTDIEQKQAHSNTNTVGLRRKDSEGRVQQYQGVAGGFRVGGQRKLDQPSRQSNINAPQVEHHLSANGANYVGQNPQETKIIPSGPTFNNMQPTQPGQAPPQITTYHQAHLAQHKSPAQIHNKQRGGQIRKRSRLTAQTSQSNANLNGPNSIGSDMLRTTKLQKPNGQSTHEQEISIQQAHYEAALLAQQHHAATVQQQQQNTERMNQLLMNYNEKVAATSSFLKDQEKLDDGNKALDIQSAGKVDNNISVTAKKEAVELQKMIDLADSYVAISNSGKQLAPVSKAQGPNESPQYHKQGNFSALYQQDNQIQSYFAKYQKASAQQPMNNQVNQTNGFSAQQHTQQLEKQRIARSSQGQMNALGAGMNQILDQHMVSSTNQQLHQFLGSNVASLNQTTNAVQGSSIQPTPILADVQKGSSSLQITQTKTYPASAVKSHPNPDALKRQPQYVLAQKNANGAHLSYVQDERGLTQIRTAPQTQLAVTGGGSHQQIPPQLPANAFIPNSAEKASGSKLLVNQLERMALLNYERFHNMPTGTATVELLQCTAAGVSGWAYGVVEVGSPPKGQGQEKGAGVPPSPPGTPGPGANKFYPVNSPQSFAGMQNSRDYIQNPNVIYTPDQGPQVITAQTAFQHHVGMHVGSQYSNSFKNNNTSSQDFYRLNVGNELDPVFKKILLNQAGLRTTGGAPNTVQPISQKAMQMLMVGGQSPAQVMTGLCMPVRGNPTNGIVPKFPLPGARIYKFQVMQGNNSNLIRRVFNETRSDAWVELANQTQGHFHFRWSPLSRQINFDRLSHNFTQMVNHVEGHNEISNKHELFKNVVNYCDERNENAFFMLPLTFCVKVTQDKLQQSLRQGLKPFKQTFKLLEEFNGLFDQECSTGSSTQGQNEKDDQKLEAVGSQTDIKKEIQPDFTEQRKNINEGKCTVLVSKRAQENGYSGASKNKRFSTKSTSLVMPMSHFAGQNIWILKPTGMNRGKGIHVVSSFKKCKKLIQEYMLGREMLIGSNQPSSTVATATASMTQKAWQLQMQNGRAVGSPPQNHRKLMPALPALPKSNVAQAYLIDTGLIEKSGANSMSAQKPVMRRNNSFYGRSKKGIKSKAKGPSALQNQKAPELEQAYDEEYLDEKDDDFDPEDSSCKSTSELTPVEAIPQSSALAQTTPKTSGYASRAQPLNHNQNLIQVPTHSVLHQKHNQSVNPPQLGRQNALAQRHLTQQGLMKKPQLPESKMFIIQKYIEQPALVYQRKFDIRVWVVLTHDLDGYFFKEGYLRTSSTAYTATKDNLEDDYVHLTNNAIQRKCPTYGQHEDGNQLSFEDFKRTLIEDKTGVDFDNDIMPQMKNQAAVCLKSAVKKFNMQKRKHCFELFGLDFIMDKDYNVFLIEANTNPCLEESSQLLCMLLPRMLDDMFKLTIDKVYPMNHQTVIFGSGTQQPQGLEQVIQNQEGVLNGNKISDSPGKLKRQPSESSPKKQPSIYPVTGYRDTQNMWSKIGAFKPGKLDSGVAMPSQSIEQTWQQHTKSDRIIHLVNAHELRVGKAEIVDRSGKREKGEGDGKESKQSKQRQSQLE